MVYRMSRRRRTAAMLILTAASGMLSSLALADAPLPQPRPAGPAESNASTAPSPDHLDAVTAACESELRHLDVRFERLDSIADVGGCGVAAPYALQQVGSHIRLRPGTTITCSTALATARWIQSIVVPAAHALGQAAQLKEVDLAGSYECRNRNGQTNEKLSEYAVGRALDVRAFQFDGHASIDVTDRAGTGTIEEAFQRAVRAGACLYFTTVLGPGTDQFHGGHLHLDLAERAGEYRLCE